MPSVSIIMPVYNKAAYLTASISSVRTQSLHDFELIIVNDGSTDGSLELIQELTKDDDRVHIITTPNAGVSNARNVGLMQACGDWIQFLDGDDLIHPDYLLHSIPLAEKYDLDILFTSFYEIDKHGQVSTHISIPETGFRHGASLADDFMRYQFKTGYFGFISNKLFRHDLLKQTNAKFPLGVTLAEDLNFYVKLYVGVKKWYYSSEISFYYLQTAENYKFRQNINYHDQINTLFDIQAWVHQSVSHAQYQTFLEQRICGYACQMLFDASEAGQSLSCICNDIRRNPKIYACLHLSYVRGINALIVLLLKCRLHRLLAPIMQTRKLIRKIYRLWRKNEPVHPI